MKTCKLAFYVLVWSSALVLGGVCVLPAATATPLTLEGILNKMEERGASLRSMSAMISQKKWTDVLEEFDQGETGQFSFLKEEGKIFLRKDILTPQENTLVVRDGKVFFYQPRIKQLQKYDLGQRSDRAEFLLLGFGSKKEALKQAYHIRLGERELVDQHETYQLELIPKSEKVLAYFPRIVLWIDTFLWIPIQQKLVEPTDDYLLIRFDQIELNPAIGKSQFELKVAEDVKVVG